jgi:diguanylate cyclase (GGDEF)-like protein
MHDPEGVREIALELARQQTGWSDLAVRDELATSETAVEIRAGERRFGVLTSAAARAGDLAPWAQWLAQWLSLDAAYREYRLLAYRDDLTGAWNRRYLKRFLSDVIGEARERRRPITVMVFDIDDFKRYNDAFGHDAGDVILCETVALLESVIREGDRVCRIGGDEFAVVFADLEPREGGSTLPASVEQLARRFQAQVSAMRFPKLGLEAPGTLSISGGLATFPWDGDDPGALLRLADQRALESKRRGKNHLTFGPGATDV